MTHEYVLLLGGVVIRGPDGPDASAIAWAGDTILALGSDDEVRSISRGDSHFVELQGRVVVPVDAAGTIAWPPTATLEIGSPASLAVLRSDPRRRRGGQASADEESVVAIVQGGRIVFGSLAGG